MATAGLIGCSPKFRALPGGFDQETLNLFDDDIFSRSIFEEIVGSSEAICRVTKQVLRVAPSNATALTTGESGTGKELIARAIHRTSRRSQAVFTRMNCAVTPPSLIAGELPETRGRIADGNSLPAIEPKNKGTISDDVICDRLYGALESSIFVRSQRLGQFLRFTVETTLDKTAETLKAYGRREPLLQAGWSGKQIGRLQSQYRKEAPVSKITAVRSPVATR